MSTPTSNISFSSLDNYFGWKSDFANLIKNSSPIKAMTSSGYYWLSRLKYFKTSTNLQDLKISDFSGIYYNFSINYSNSYLLPNKDIGYINLDFNKNFIIDLNIMYIPTEANHKIFQTGKGTYADSGFIIYVVSADSENYYLNVKWTNSDATVSYDHFTNNIILPKSSNIDYGWYKLTLIYDGIKLYANTSINTFITNNLIPPNNYSYNLSNAIMNSKIITNHYYSLFGLRIFGSLYDNTSKINAIILNDNVGNVALLLVLTLDIFLNSYVVIRNLSNNNTFCFGQFTGLGKFLLTEKNDTYNTLAFQIPTLAVNYSPGVTAGIVFGNTLQIEAYNSFIDNGNNKEINILPIFRHTFNKVDINISNGMQYNYNLNRTNSWDGSPNDIWYYKYTYDFKFIPYWNGSEYRIDGALLTSDISLFSNSLQVYFDKSYGTIGRGYTGPGFVYSGVDFITPGNPFESFGFILNNSTNLIFQNGIAAYAAGNFYQKSNNYISYMTGYINTGYVSCQYILPTYVETNMVLRILMSYTNTTNNSMTIKAIREFDPDQDVPNYGIWATLNKRGFGNIPANQIVTSLGTNSKIRVSLYYPGFATKSTNRSNFNPISNVNYNTSISTIWTKNPDYYISGSDYFSGQSGDYALGIGWDLGTIQPGETFSIPCYYIVTTDEGDENYEANKIQNIIDSNYY